MYVIPRQRGPRMMPYILAISHLGQTKQAEKIALISMLCLDEIPKTSFESFSAVVTLESRFHSKGLVPKNQHPNVFGLLCSEKFSSF